VQPNPETNDNIPEPQIPTSQAPVPPASGNTTPNRPEVTEPGRNNPVTTQYRPISRNPAQIEPIVLQLDDSKTPLSSPPTQNETAAQDESTPPEDAPSPQEETIEDPQVPLMSEVIIDPTGINPAFIIIPLIAVIVIVGAIGFIRFRRKTSAV